MPPLINLQAVQNQGPMEVTPSTGFLTKPPWKKNEAAPGAWHGQGHVEHTTTQTPRAHLHHVFFPCPSFMAAFILGGIDVSVGRQNEGNSSSVKGSQAPVVGFKYTGRSGKKVYGALHFQSERNIYASCEMPRRFTGPASVPTADMWSCPALSMARAATTSCFRKDVFAR